MKRTRWVKSVPLADVAGATRSSLRKQMLVTLVGLPVVAVVNHRGHRLPNWDFPAIMVRLVVV